MPVRTIELATGMTLWADGFTILPPSKVDVVCCWARQADPEALVAPLPDWMVARLVAGTAYRPGEP